MKVCDFINVGGQQNFEENEINSIGIKIENNKTQNMLEKYKKYPIRFNLKDMRFSSSIKTDTEKIFVKTLGLLGAKYSLVNGKLYQTVGVINLNQIENW